MTANSCIPPIRQRLGQQCCLNPVALIGMLESRPMTTEAIVRYICGVTGLVLPLVREALELEQSDPAVVAPDGISDARPRALESTSSSSLPSPPGSASPEEHEHQDTRVVDSQYDPPPTEAEPLATAAQNKPVPTNDGTLPYERVDSRALTAAMITRADEHVLVLQPFGWHLDGAHIPNAAEQFSRDGICDDHHWEVVREYGPYIAIVRPRQS